MAESTSKQLPLLFGTDERDPRLHPHRPLGAIDDSMKRLLTFAPQELVSNELGGTEGPGNRFIHHRVWHPRVRFVWAPRDDLLAPAFAADHTSPCDWLRLGRRWRLAASVAVRKKMKS